MRAIRCQQAAFAQASNRIVEQSDRPGSQSQQRADHHQQRCGRAIISICWRSGKRASFARARLATDHIAIIYFIHALGLLPPKFRLVRAANKTLPMPQKD
jgi:hypothetical protein